MAWGGADVDVGAVGNVGVEVMLGNGVELGVIVHTNMVVVAGAEIVMDGGGPRYGVAPAMGGVLIPGVGQNDPGGALATGSDPRPVSRRISSRICPVTGSKRTVAQGR